MSTNNIKANFRYIVSGFLPSNIDINIESISWDIKTIRVKRILVSGNEIDFKYYSPANWG